MECHKLIKWKRISKPYHAEKVFREIVRLKMLILILQLHRRPLFGDISWFM